MTESKQSVRLRHGWVPQGDAMIVTKATGRTVQELDGQPAIDAFLGQLGVAKNTIDFQNFYKFAMHYPLGMPSTGNSYVVRDPFSADATAGSITYVTEIPENSVVRIMTSTDENLIAAAKEAIDEVNRDLAGQKPSFIFVADCISRRLMLGTEIDKELQMISAQAGGLPTFGLLSVGEIGFERGGPPMLANKTCAVYALAE